jgi:hypothetical protein
MMDLTRPGVSSRLAMEYRMVAMGEDPWKYNCPGGFPCSLIRVQSSDCSDTKRSRSPKTDLTSYPDGKNLVEAVQKPNTLVKQKNP